ncbi:MAG: pentapeptide repeat-containing protein [Bacteriovoracia bacterium]
MVVSKAERNGDSLARAIAAAGDPDAIYTYDAESGTCRNAKQEVGLNIVTQIEEVGPCAQLSDTNLVDENFALRELDGSNLSRSYLTEAQLTEASLVGANLEGADLTGADLAKADLTDANLAAAILDEADLTGARLDGANLSGASLFKTKFKDVSLVQAKLDQLDLTQLLDDEDVNWEAVKKHAASREKTLFPK